MTVGADERPGLEPQSSQARLYRLTPWLIRALMPPQRCGHYILYANGAPPYVGRSDVCLRTRLLRHAYRRRAAFFTFDVHAPVAHAFVVECAYYHALEPQLANLIHPDHPSGMPLKCPFCRDGWASTHPFRRDMIALYNPNPTAQGEAA